ncbi:MAG TPA: redoxin family protein [Thermoanaerobaculia bacterium]
MTTVRSCLIVFLLLSCLVASASAQDRAICAVCGPREGAGLEPVKATAIYKGEHYYFCSNRCKVEFLKEPDAFLVSDEGTQAPPFRLKAFDGTSVSLADFRGQVVLLDFWATFCPPCIAALPELQALHAKNAMRGFSVVGVTVDDRAAMVRKATSQAKVSYPILQSTPEVWNAYSVTALPAMVLVGRDGRIIRRYGGEADKVAMLAEIERAIAVPAVTSR